MEKRLLLAVALSIFVLLSWSLLTQKAHHIENKEVTIQQSPAPSVLPEQSAPVETQQKSNPEDLLEYNSDKLAINFGEPQAASQDLTFPQYHNYKFILHNGLSIGDTKLSFRKESVTKETITFSHADTNQRIEKKFIFSNSGYSIWLELKIQNLSQGSLDVNFPLILGTLDFAPVNLQSRYQDITIATSEKTLHLNA